MKERGISKILIIFIVTIVVAVGAFIYAEYEKSKIITNEPKTVKESVEYTIKEVTKQKEDIPVDASIPTRYEITLPKHYYQTFNNCGPATLSMVFNYYGLNTSQEEIGQILRPHQNPQGDNDDKSVSLAEMAKEAENNGFIAYYLPNGTIEKMEKLIANNIPVITVTWLNNKEDIGHYRIVRGYDQEKEILIQDDSYQGPNKIYTYNEFNSLWQPFNYKYLIIVDEMDKETVESIIKDETKEKVAWENAKQRALKEKTEQPNNPYTDFNVAVAEYYLKNYMESVKAYEKVQNQVPGRMLWYQYEPLLAYKEIGEYDVVLNSIKNILENNNLAYAELYKLRGDIYLEQGKVEEAKSEYEKAIFYNKNYEEAKETLTTLK